MGFTMLFQFWLVFLPSLRQLSSLVGESSPSLRLEVLGLSYSESTEQRERERERERGERSWIIFLLSPLLSMSHQWSLLASERSSDLLLLFRQCLAEKRFTVNPRRRIRQHNGEITSGAWRTKRKCPWEMVLCIYGFPTMVSTLQFEWAWQHTNKSLVVREAVGEFKSLAGIVNKIKLAYAMVNLLAWQSKLFLDKVPQTFC
ncbi:uncharacterized protein LOC122057637 isoform X2 [Macadamia integrifolia]|uniref:uncharacterized protein LOC122057637 isoform X2 n=1 Tax=Macadamia integrifolia TaxID=60698 RepID=UPI001C52949A|nr:uncharacterized protein LOC122057637 isoform X2 [Macadamia integrifolia]